MKEEIGAGGLVRDALGKDLRGVVHESDGEGGIGFFNEVAGLLI